MSFYKYCPKCGDINFIDKCVNCVFCGEPYIKTDVVERADDCTTNVLEEIEEKYVKHNPQFDEKLYNKRVEENNAIIYRTSSYPRSKNVPKCPTCGSTNVEKISTAKKAFGFAMVGLFSSNLGKTMHCKNCGYKW